MLTFSKGLFSRKEGSKNNIFWSTHYLNGPLSDWFVELNFIVSLSSCPTVFVMIDSFRYEWLFERTWTWSVCLILTDKSNTDFNADLREFVCFSIFYDDFYMKIFVFQSFFRFFLNLKLSFGVLIKRELIVTLLSSRSPFSSRP